MAKGDAVDSVGLVAQSAGIGLNNVSILEKESWVRPWNMATLRSGAWQVMHENR